MQLLNSVPGFTFPVPLLGKDALFFLLLQTVLVLKYFFRYFFKQGGLWLQLVSRWRNWQHYIATLKQIILPHGIITLI